MQLFLCAGDKTKEVPLSKYLIHEAAIKVGTLSSNTLARNAGSLPIMRKYQTNPSEETLYKTTDKYSSRGSRS